MKKLFLVDGIGAVVSAVLLGIVLVQFQVYFGIPTSTLYFLAALPCAFAIYDFYCFFKVDKQLEKYLKGIALVNYAYCVLSIGLAIYHSASITYLGWGYVLLEVMIVIGLATFELETARKSQES
ncbi:MAG: hypothetical protein P8P74_15635 [Crocinitomicaceae bacterium]|nr:hypothetical protein [Crocinitomicaceae bacterium]